MKRNGFATICRIMDGDSWKCLVMRICLAVILLSLFMGGMCFYFMMPEIFLKSFVFEKTKKVYNISLPLETHKCYPKRGKEFVFWNRSTGVKNYLFTDRVIDILTSVTLKENRGLLIVAKKVPKNKLLRLFFFSPTKYYIIVRGYSTPWRV